MHGKIIKGKNLLNKIDVNYLDWFEIKDKLYFQLKNKKTFNSFDVVENKLIIKTIRGNIVIRFTTIPELEFGYVFNGEIMFNVLNKTIPELKFGYLNQDNFSLN